MSKVHNWQIGREMDYPYEALPLYPQFGTEPNGFYILP